VSLYTWTKGIATGAYFVAGALVLAGRLPADSRLWLWGAPLLALVFLAATLGLLVSDLTHPARFYMVLTRPQWRSWLARGGVILTVYGLLLAAHVGSAALGRDEWLLALAWPGLPLAALAAVYTAFLFAQAKARDLWQSPLLPPQLLVHAVASGAAALFALAPRLEPGAAARLAVLGGTATLAHLLLVASELASAHPTSHARLAAREMTRGRYRHFFAAGVALSAAGALASFARPESALWVPLVLLGLLAHEHAFVQAGQAVPLA
jgi:formate-dependent nitrite reductase membrane component NrfD